MARLASTAVDPAPDAFTIINGGPGGSSVDLLVDLVGAIQPITRERDVLVIDQRGTGRSAPLNCDTLTDAVDTPSLDQTIALTEECLASLPHDPRFFTTSVAVDDLEALRATLGYQQLSVYGVSYGTRVAMHYARQHPQQTRAVIVDGVVPPQLPLGPEIPLRSQYALDAMFERCSSEAACREQFPALREDFSALQNRLQTQPIAMTIRHPVTGKNTDLELSYGHLAMWIRLALYAPESSALLPLTIAQAANDDDFLPIAANALRMLHQLNTSMQYGMHNAVVCTEDTPYYEVDPADLEGLADTYMGSDIYTALSAMCSVWPAGVMDDSMNEALHSDVPTLVLSGEFDPITPPEYGEQIMPGLSNASHVIAPGQGHGVIGRGCVPKLILEFVEGLDLDSLNTSCTQHLSAFPFFLDAMGPAP